MDSFLHAKSRIHVTFLSSGGPNISKFILGIKMFQNLIPGKPLIFSGVQIFHDRKQGTNLHAPRRWPRQSHCASYRPLFALHLRVRLTCFISFFASVSHFSAETQFSPNNGPRPKARSNVACPSFLPLPHLRRVTLPPGDICCAQWVKDVQAESTRRGVFAGVVWLARPSHLNARGAEGKGRSSGSND